LLSSSSDSSSLKGFAASREILSSGLRRASILSSWLRVSAGAGVDVEEDEFGADFACTDTDPDLFAEVCADTEVSRGFGALETDFGMAFFTFGVEITLTFTLVLFSAGFVRKLLISSSE